MSSVTPGFVVGSSRHTDSVARELCALLDTLVALRMDLGHDANGMGASPELGPSQMREIRLMVDNAIASLKDIIGMAPPTAVFSVLTPRKIISLGHAD